jgi:UDP-glucose 4-epimerase
VSPTGVAGDFTFFPCDLTSPSADQALADFLREMKCDTLVHAAVHSQPKRNEEFSHELLSIGTMYLLHAVKAAGVKKLIVSSTTEVYGAYPDNPNFLTEEHPLRGRRLSSFLRDKVAIETQCATFAQTCKQVTVTLLRPCTILGPQIRNYKTHLLKEGVIPTVMGFDPMMQFVHEEDVCQAFLLALRRRAPGAYNIVGDGVLPLSKALELIGKFNLPVPSPILHNATWLLWHLNIQQTPPTHIQFWKYPCVADGAKACKALGFHPTYDMIDVLQAFQKEDHHGA